MFSGGGARGSAFTPISGGRRTASVTRTPSHDQPDHQILVKDIRKERDFPPFFLFQGEGDAHPVISAPEGYAGR